MTTAAWDSYDDAADDYARVAGRFHAQVARDLVAATGPRFASRVLDLGAGSWVAAAEAAQAVGPDGTVVAVDPARNLVRLARTAPAFPVVGRAPGLPFADAAFDAVVASLVIGHFPDYRPAIADMTRVVRPGGRLGLATWGRVDDTTIPDDDAERAAHAVWDAVVGAVVDLDALDDRVAAVLPWEEWFADPARLRAALGAAGLRVVECFGRVYRSPCSHGEWLERIDTGVRARAVRHELGAERYAGIRADVAAALLAAGVVDPVVVSDEMVITVAVRSGSEVHR